MALSELSRALLRIWNDIPHAFQQSCRTYEAKLPGMHHCQWWTHALLTLRTELKDTLRSLYHSDKMDVVMMFLIKTIFN